MHSEDFSTEGSLLAVDYAAAGVDPAVRSVRIVTSSGSERKASTYAFFLDCEHR